MAPINLVNNSLQAPSQNVGPIGSQRFSVQELASISRLMSDCSNTTETLTKDFCKKVMRNIITNYFPATKIPIIILYVLLFLVGVSGNLLVILCVLLHRHMRSATNMFLLNLALSDLLIFLICEPWVVGSYFYNSWIYGEVICKLHAVLQGTSLGVSIFTLASLSVERFIMIASPLRTRFGSVIRKDIMAVWIIFIWVGAFVVCLPLYFAYEIVPMGLKVGGDYVVDICLESWTTRPYGKRIFTVFLFLAFYLIPLVFMSCLLFRISKYLLIHFHTGSENHGTGSQRENQGIYCIRQKRRRIWQLLLILLIIFAICWLPYHVINLSVDFLQKKERNRHSKFLHWIVDYFDPVAQFLAFTNSAINPICTLVVSEKFRMALSLLKQCACFHSREYMRQNQRKSVDYVSRKVQAGPENELVPMDSNSCGVVAQSSF